MHPNRNFSGLSGRARKTIIWKENGGAHDNASESYKRIKLCVLWLFLIKDSSIYCIYHPPCQKFTHSVMQIRSRDVFRALPESPEKLRLNAARLTSTGCGRKTGQSCRVWGICVHASVFIVNRQIKVLSSTNVELSHRASITVMFYSLCTDDCVWRGQASRCPPLQWSESGARLLCYLI